MPPTKVLNLKPERRKNVRQMHVEAKAHAEGYRGRNARDQKAFSGRRARRDHASSPLRRLGCDDDGGGDDGRAVDDGPRTRERPRAGRFHVGLGPGTMARQSACESSPPPSPAFASLRLMPWRRDKRCERSRRVLPRDQLRLPGLPGDALPRTALRRSPVDIVTPHCAIQCARARADRRQGQGRRWISRTRGYSEQAIAALAKLLCMIQR